MKLFRSVLLLMLFASAVPTAVLGWLLASTSRAQLATDALELAGERVERLRLQAAGQLADVRRAVEEAAREAPWSELSAGDRRAELAGLLQRRDEVTVVTLYDRAGRKIRGLQAFPSSVAPSEIAEHELRTAPLLAGLPAAGGAPRWSPVYAAPRRGEVAMTLVIPLDDAAVGAVAAEISLATLQRLAARTRVGARGAAFIVDASGRYVAHPEADRVLTRAEGGEGSIVAAVDRALAAPAEMQGARVAEFRGAGGEVLGAYAVLPEVGWGVVAAQPKADAFASVERMRRTALAGALLSAALAVVLGAWFARGIARPVSELVKGALEIARGHFGREMKVEARNEIGDLAYTFNHMSRELKSYDAENRRLIAALEDGYLDTIRSLAGAIDAKDAYTRGHNQRVAELAVEIGQEMRADDRILRALAYGGLLHDVGKIGIPEPVLRKEVPLDESEMMLMREHPVIGAEIVRGVEFLRDAVPAIRSHHERWDGGGYPDGLRGEAIPLVARIVNAADTWDACTSSRPYQPAMGADEVIRILARLRGTQIDPAVHDALVAVLNRWTGGAMARGTGARAGQIVAPPPIRP